MSNRLRRNLTYGQLLDLVLADGALPKQRRANVASSIRTLLRVSGKTPAMPADFVSLRHALEAIHPTRHGITPRRWSNLKSDLRFALERYGAPTRAPLREELSPAWQELRTLVDDVPKFKRGLSALMHWASARGIEPQDVCDTVLERYLAHLHLRTLRGQPQKRHRYVCKLWNEARDRYARWPRSALAVPSYRRQLSFAWSDFTAAFRADMEAYVRFMSGADILAEKAPAPRRRSTLAAHREHFRRFASALVRSGHPIEAITTLAVLTEPAKVKAALAYYQTWLGDDLRKHPSIHEMLSAVTVMARDYCGVPADHLAVLQEYRKRLNKRRRGFTEKNRERLSPLRDPAVQARFLCLGESLLKEARRMKRPHRQALLVQQALAHEVLLVAPMRINNLCSLHLEKNIRWAGSDRHPRAQLVIQPDDVKNAEYLDFDLPEPLVRLLKEYLKTYRPRLLSGSDGGWLFPGAGRDHKHKVTLSSQLCRTVETHVGITVNVHLYRHIAAFFYLQEHPGEYETVRRLLGHKSVETTIMFYAEFEGVAARRLYASHILDLRQEARQRIGTLP